MKKNLIIIAVVLFISGTTKAQNLFFIGEKSYHCTESITLQSNAGYAMMNLTVLFAKDGTTGGLFVVSTESTYGGKFYGKLIIYLDDGTVITFNDSKKSDRVDERANAVYSLTNEDLIKMKNSDINTVRYTISNSISGSSNGNWSVLNNGTNTKTLVADFFGE